MNDSSPAVAGLPGDDHVHTEFSYDAERGSMLAACQQAVDLGLPSIAFTEHIDRTPWHVPPEFQSKFDDMFRGGIDHHHCFHAPEFDVDGYFEMVERCRRRYPSLRILAGLELGEPHWFPEHTTELLGSGQFDRVLGSIHSVKVADHYRLIDEWFRSEALVEAAEDAAVHQYLAEAVAMIKANDDFEVFAHIDYLTRQIVATGRSHDPRRYEESYRETLRALAGSERVLEINTRVPLDPIIVMWWHDMGGGAISFGSDAHEGPKVGHGFEAAAAMAESIGYGPRPDRLDFWHRA